MNYSTLTKKQPYVGWLDIMTLEERSIVFHDAITEKPKPSDVIIPIAFIPGDGLDRYPGNLPLSEWPWEFPDLLVLPPVFSHDFKVIQNDAIVLWWLSCNEIVDNLLEDIPATHFASKAVFTAMKHLEDQIGGDTDG